jgi:hypothetical protein
LPAPFWPLRAFFAGAFLRAGSTLVAGRFLAPTFFAGAFLVAIIYPPDQSLPK